MNIFLTAAFLALASNRLVEAFAAPVRKKWPELDLWFLVYVAWLVGGALSYLSGINLFTELVPTLPPWLGQAVTALVVGGGSNLIHDVFNRTPTNTLTATTTTPGTMTATVQTDAPGPISESRGLGGWPPKSPDRPIKEPRL